MQTLALLHDSLRLLLARKLFWITLAISGLLVLAYGSIGFDEKGISILFGLFHFEDPRFTAGSPIARAFILGIFTTFIVPVWLGWGATILGLVSTCNTYPDLMSDGAIDLVLSKPLGRIKIFLVKYLGALLFVALQTTLFCAGVFLVIGLRIGEWNWMIFAGAGVVVLFFSYLFSFLTLISIVTRSTIASLLFTMLFWFALFIAQQTERSLSEFRQLQQVEVESLDRRIEGQKARLERARNPGGIRDALGSALTDPERLAATIETLEEEREKTAGSVRALETWHARSRVMMAVLPKNQETIGLLDRWLIRDQSMTMQEIMFGAVAPPPQADPSAEPKPDAGPNRHELTASQVEASRRERSDRREKSAWFIVGTSLAFEFALLAVAGWIFVRRDF